MLTTPMHVCASHLYLLFAWCITSSSTDGRQLWDYSVWQWVCYSSDLIITGDSTRYSELRQCTQYQITQLRVQSTVRLSCISRIKGKQSLPLLEEVKFMNLRPSAIWSSSGITFITVISLQGTCVRRRRGCTRIVSCPGPTHEELCVEWGSTNTTSTSMFKISHVRYEVKT